MTPEENNLIISAQKGDRASFERLIYSYDKNVLAIAYSYINNREDAKDIYQEVFIRVFRSIEKFQFKSEFSTWLYRITANVCLTYRAKRKKYSYASLDENIEDEDGSEKSFAETIAGDINADEEALSSDIQTNIEKGLEKLSPQQKLVFTLKHFQELKIKEIASIMNCTEGTVKNYLFMATQRMREHLKDLVG